MPEIAYHCVKGHCLIYLLWFLQTLKSPRLIQIPLNSLSLRNGTYATEFQSHRVIYKINSHDTSGFMLKVNKRSCNADTILVMKSFYAECFVIYLPDIEKYLHLYRQIKFPSIYLPADYSSPEVIPGHTGHIGCIRNCILLSYIVGKI